MKNQNAELDIWDPATEAEQQEFFRLAFSRYGKVGEKLAERAKLIFKRPAEFWPSEKIIVEIDGKRRFYPTHDDIGRDLAEVADTLAYEFSMNFYELNSDSKEVF